MPNTLATPTWVLREVGRGYVNSVKFIANVNRKLSDEYVQAGAKVGYTVNYRLPQRWAVTDGQSLQLQAINDQVVPVTLTNQKNVAFGYSTASQTMEIQDVKKRYVDKAADALANAADVLAYNAVYRDVWNSVGTPGTTPSTALTYLTAGVKLDNTASPMEDRVAILDPLAAATIANATATLFNPSGAISENWRKGMMAANQLGIDEWYKDQSRSVHTTGTFTSSTPIVSSANQTGSSVGTSGWASGASTLNKGDIVTFAGCYGVNPLSYQSTGVLQQFTVTATTSDSGGAMTIPISPPIVTSGAYQTVTASPTNNGAVSVWSGTGTYALTATTSPQSMVFHPDAFAFVTADLARDLGGADVNVVRSSMAGFSIRMVQQYQIGTDQNPSRLDILIGAATLQARLACRVVG